MQVSIFIVVFLFLSGCAGPVTKDSLRQDAANKVNFDLDKPYQRVFSDLLKQTRMCYLHKETKRQITVVGHRNNGGKTASIVVEEVFATAGQDTYLVIDIVSKSKNLTSVSAYISSAEGKQEVNSIKDWAQDGNTTCQVNWLL